MVTAESVYAALGVRRVINAADTYTDLGGARLPDEVAAAMLAGSRHQVDIRELLARSGEHLAAATRNPAALVVNGAAAAVAVTVAAAGGGLAARHATPAHVLRERGAEVIVLCSQRNPYDAGIELAGARIRQVGYSDSLPRHELTAAIGENTIAIMWFAGTQFERYSPPLSDLAALAREHGIPLIVDAAAQFPPVENLWRYREEGASLVFFSGGKGLKGPQASGLILGESEWVAACALNSYPNHGTGRGMKTSKENILGLVAAVDRALKLDWEAQYAAWTGRLEDTAARLRVLPWLDTRIDPAGRQGQACPRLFLSWPASTCAATASELAAHLAALPVSIRIDANEADARTALINPYSLLDGELHLVTEALISALTSLRENHA